MRISIGSDHAGFEFKEGIRHMLGEMGHEVNDVGTYSAERADYPDFAVKVARAVSKAEADYGVLVCGTGIGVAITANKISGVRAATCVTEQMAQLARAHNNANVVCTGERLVSLFEAKDIVKVFLNTPFDEGRHTARVAKIHELTGR